MEKMEGFNKEIKNKRCRKSFRECSVDGQAQILFLQSVTKSTFTCQHDALWQVWEVTP